MVTSNRVLKIGPKIGLALGSGGARGWCHIGAIRALLAEGIEPDIIAGCSMGALVGAAYATGTLDELEDWATSINWRKMASYVDVNLVGGGLIEGRHIVEYLNKINKNPQIEKLEKRFTAIASDLVMGREIWLQDGPINEAVRASIALPGIFSPVKLKDKWLLDGGMTNPVPVSACRAMGAEIIIAVNPNAGLLGFHTSPNFRKERSPKKEEAKFKRDIIDRLFDVVPERITGSLKTIMPDSAKPHDRMPSYIDVLSTSIDIMTNQILRSRLAGEPPHVMINPQLNNLAVLEFNRAKEAIAEGQTSTQRALPLLKDYLA